MPFINFEQLIHIAYQERKILAYITKGWFFWGCIHITALHDDVGDVIGFTKLTREIE